MVHATRFRQLALLAAAPALFACASAPEPAPQPTPARPVQPPPDVTPPPAASVAPALEPSAAATRTADRIALTGRELGTMWTFENPPLAYWKETYGFDATPQWLEHVRLSSVRYGEICSASFVSPNGLVMTNHHCARECVEAQSTGGTDYVEQGFYAATRAEERVCPELFLDQLIAIEDVTQRVRAGTPAGATPTQVQQAQEEAVDRIETECEQRTSNTCQVVALYQGGQHQLYQYKRFSPVKLVFAPELQAGFFGGDPDNFTYPRYALDVAFVRAYGPNDQPASTPHHFPWRAEGASEGELVFVTGNPGSTSRLITVAQVLYEQQYRHPFLVYLLGGQRTLLQEMAETSPEVAQQVRQQLFEIENSLKAYTGQLAGLRDTLLVGRKIRWERELRQRVAADPQRAQRFGDLWDRMAALQAKKLEVSPRLNVANKQLIGAPHLLFAGQLVAYLRESAKPEAEQSAQFRGAAQQIRTMLQSPSPVDDALGAKLLAIQLGIATRFLSREDPLVRDLLRPGESADDAASRLVRESRVLDPMFRSELLAGGLTAAQASTDPLIRFALVAEDAYPRLVQEWQQTIAEEDVQNARLAEALFAVYGTGQPPDATFTLRISDGVVQGYPYNGTLAPAHTTIFGLYGRAAAFSNEMPWTLPSAFEKAKGKVDMSKPLDMVSTNDITGGNSGSPLIDRQARVVGIAFDGNIEQLPNEFVFRTDAGRTVSVHSAGILEALRSVYNAAALVTELTGSNPARSN
jgi:hypothetical protein